MLPAPLNSHLIWMTKAHPATQNLPLRQQLQAGKQRAERRRSRGRDYSKVLRAHSAVCFPSYLSVMKIWAERPVSHGAWSHQETAQEITSSQRRAEYLHSHLPSLTCILTSSLCSSSRGVDWRAGLTSPPGSNPRKTEGFLSGFCMFSTRLHGFSRQVPTVQKQADRKLFLAVFTLQVFSAQFWFLFFILAFLWHIKCVAIRQSVCMDGWFHSFWGIFPSYLVFLSFSDTTFLHAV